MKPKKKNKSLTAAVRDVTRSARGMNRDLWDGDSMIPEIRDTLLDIAKRVWDELTYDDAELMDIVVTGSMTGPNWSDDSDIDLHLMVQFSDINDDEELVDDFFKMRSRIWNQGHDITLVGHPVEVYVQDVDSPHYSSAIYSLVEDDWVKRKEPGSMAGESEVLKMTKEVSEEVKEVIKTLQKPDWREITDATKFMKDLRESRSRGLERGGEGSVENLSYKALRRMGLLDELNDSIKSGFDKMFN